MTTTEARTAPRTAPDPVPAAVLCASRLPRPTTTRLFLLVLVATAGASFATWWWLVKERAHWPGAQLACLPDPSAAGPVDPMDTVTGFTRCVDGVRLDQAALVLCGPLALLLLALLVRAAARAFTLSRRRTGPADPRTAATLASVVPHGARRPPQLVVRRTTRIGFGARAAGSARRPRVVVDPGLRMLPRRDVEAVFRHEVAHLDARDVGRVRLALAAGWVLLVGVTVPLATEVWRAPGALGTALALRLAAVLAVVGLTLCAVLRVREHDADVRASADPRDPDAMAAYVLKDRPPTPGRRVVQALGLATHPTRRARLDVLARPTRLWGLGPTESLVTGLAAGLVCTDLALLVTALTPDSIATGYRITGALTGWALAGVVTVALWRAAAVGHPDAYGPRPAYAGAALGFGVLAGSQLAARAAGDWAAESGTADGLTASFSLADASTGRQLALALALVVGGALFTTWVAALARAARARPGGPRSAPACAAAVVLSGLVLALPLGTWFLCAALAAGNADSTAYWGALDSRGWAVAATATLFGALAPFAATAVRRSRPRPRGVPALAVALFVLPAAVWIPLAGSDDTSPRRILLPGTVAAGDAPGGGSVLRQPPPERPDDAPVPIDQLSPLPPIGADGAAPVTDPFLACRALAIGGSALWVDPDGRRETGELLVAVEDPVLRAVSAVLLRSLPERVHSDVHQAAELRCDLLYRYAR
ncbi:M48 family metalloprotease [Streptomyces sp. NPDC048057]|uniref:M48 family metalloprotease n=1 Tax=Streptomyces sp. NPDC048057 TaxID=3155628 RepID=UPI00340C502C